MAKKLLWKIYYTDGSTFSDVDGAWNEAPARGVATLVTADPEVGRELDRGQEFYIWWPGAEKPWGVDYPGLWDYLVEIGAPEAEDFPSSVHWDDIVSQGVKLGRSMGNVEYRKLMQKALRDSDFEPKSAVTERERGAADRIDIVGEITR